MGFVETRLNCRACGKEFVWRSNQRNGSLPSYCLVCATALGRHTRGGLYETSSGRATPAGNAKKRKRKKQKRHAALQGSSGKKAHRGKKNRKSRTPQKGGNSKPYWQAVCCVCKRAFFTDKEPPRRELVQCPQCLRRRVDRFLKRQDG